MKRIVALVLLVCILLCGCKIAEPSDTQAPTTETAPSKPTQETTVPIETTTPTEATEAPTEPAKPEKVTVYLLVREDMFDSGYIKYTYDKNYNIDCYEVINIEGDPMFTQRFEKKDANGMPCQSQQEGSPEIHTITWFQDGKIKEEQYDPNFSGYQYEYNQKGDVVQKREYYEGILECTVIYEYGGDTLKAVYSENPQGTKLYECRVKNGKIVEKVGYQEDGSVEYTVFYTYDKNGCLEKTEWLYDEERTPGSTYTYKAVKVDADRAQYLTEQQKYLLSIA